MRSASCPKRSAAKAFGPSAPAMQRRGWPWRQEKAGVPCKVLTMDTAPAAKLDAIRRLGAEIVQTSYDECWKALGARSHPAMTGAFVHPFEDDEFIAGNASCGLEILEDLPDVDAVVRGLRRRRFILRHRCCVAGARQQGPSIRGRTRNSRSSGGILRRRIAAEISRLEGQLRRRMRRKIRLPAHVGDCTPSARRLGRSHARRSPPGDEDRCRAESHHRRRRGRLRGRGRTQRKMRLRKSCLRGKRRKHRLGGLLEINLVETLLGTSRFRSKSTAQPWLERFAHHHFGVTNEKLR